MPIDIERLPDIAYRLTGAKCWVEGREDRVLAIVKDDSGYKVHFRSGRNSIKVHSFREFMEHYVITGSGGIGS